MKRILLIFFLVLVVVGGSKAQQKAFQFGFKAAPPSMGWIKPNSEGYSRDGLKAGFNWGGFVGGEFFLMENYAITTGFNVIYTHGAYTIPTSKTSEDRI